MSEDFKKVFLEAQERIRETQKKADAALEGVPFECRRFPSETINRIILIRKDLKRVTADLDIKRALAVTRGYLDSHPWKAKFTTGLVGQPDRAKDSLYYVTQEGISLRLKMANAEGGDITRVIRSCKEVIFFEDGNNHIFLEPRIGLTVQEYVSPEFLAVQDGGKAKDSFESKVRIYRKGGQVIFIRNVPNGLSHTGHTVNTIL